VVVPRSLADQMRGWSDEQLARLLELRPDVAVPPPRDSGQLASRLSTDASVRRAVGSLSVLDLTVLDAVCVLGERSCLEALRQVVNASPDATDVGLRRLQEAALVWGGTERLRAVAPVRQVLGATVSGLGDSAARLLTGYGPDRVIKLARSLELPPSGNRSTDIDAIASVLADPVRVEGLVAETDARAQAILDRLERAGCDGRAETAERQPGRHDPVGPVDQLLARGLLVARDPRHVAVPREVAVCLRGGRTTREPVDVIPALATQARDRALVDTAAAGAALDFVGRVELLLEHWAASPPPVLRAGGLAVRDLRAAAGLLQVEDKTAALHAEVAAAAGLLGHSSTEDLGEAWLPTTTFDTWCAQPPAERWVVLASAWLDCARLVGLVGERIDDKPVNALSPLPVRQWLPAIRRAALQQLAQLADGEVLATGTGPTSLVARMRWLRPRGPAERDQAVGWSVREAAALGMTGLNGLSAHGRMLLADDPRTSATLSALLPQPVDHVLLQADLTAVAPGPLERELAGRLAAVAEVESRGGATVYRFTEPSIRRAFDAGWAAADIHGLLAEASRTPVPQPLAYLVDEVARRFGTVRIGAVDSFLRSDDGAQLVALLNHPKAGSLRLRRIAPTVLVSDAPVDVLLQRLHQLGVAPVVEGPDGEVRLSGRERRRASTPRRPPGGGSGAHAASRAGTVAAIRAGDEAAAARPATGDGISSPAAVLASLREAADGDRTVVIGYLDRDGSSMSRLVDPIHVRAGQLSAFEHRSQQVRLFAVHRITAVTSPPG
jgi:hypothetical protein